MGNEVDFQDIFFAKDEISRKYIWINAHYSRSNYENVEDGFRIYINIFGGETSITESGGDVIKPEDDNPYISIGGSKYSVGAAISYFRKFKVFNKTEFDIDSKTVKKYSKKILRK